jgi:hypothetical protein
MSDLVLIENFDLSIFEVVNGKVNLTKICQYFGKNINDWTKTKQTQAFLRAFARSKAETNIIVSLKGGDNEQGSFTPYREVALKLAQWISPEFEVWCIGKIDQLLQSGKVELQPAPQRQLPTNYIEALESLLESEKSKQKLQLENKQQASEIQGLANNLKETKETLAKNYKTIQARNKAEIGLSINRLVNKFFKTDDLTFAQACHKAWDSYYEVTGVHYYGATNSSFEEKLSFLNYLLSL